MKATLFCLAMSASSPAWAAALPGTAKPPQNTAAAQLEEDPYTRYELLDPASGKFRILYNVTATGAGTTSFFNPIRKGSIVSDERVTDLATGKPLRFRVISGATAKASGFPSADPSGEYLQVMLGRPVPPNGGEGRILIDKTYEDRKSYYVDGDLIVFSRPLGIDRNAVVLPAGYSIVFCNFPSQVLQEADGRTRISFWNNSPAEAPLLLKARRIARSSGATSVPADELQERASQTREIVYELQQPETHSFALYHDYTETRPGTSTYVNIVRTGSSVSGPKGVNLDTGAELTSQIIHGAAIRAADPEAAEVTSSTEAVLFHFPPLPVGGTARLRFYETYTDPGSYRRVGDELVWDRTFGRAANAVVLPSGWVLTNSSAPAITSELADGRTRLDFINPQSGELRVIITARKRANGN